QGISSRAYARMRVALDSAFAGARPLIYAGGHDHTLQVIAGTSTRYVLVSGSGTFGHSDRVATLDSTRFARDASGFMRVEFLRDGRARLGVLIVDRAGNAADVLDLSRFAGGLTPTGCGGRRQTKVLRLLGKDGRQYAFRSVDKDPTLALPPELRATFAKDLVQDQISSAHPGAPLVVAPLLDAT